MRRVPVIRDLSLVGVLIVFLPSCNNLRLRSSKTHRFCAKKLSEKSVSAIDIHVQEAKMADIPIPLSSKAMPKYFNASETSVILGYEDTTLSPSDVKNFYIQEMERLGWQKKEQFDGYESKLRFKKPHHSCIISICSDETNNRTQFVISTGFIDKSTVTA